MGFHVFNTLTRSKEPFAPAEAGHVKMYVCGPTVYDLSHIGHARVYVAFDTIVRVLRRHFRVTYVRNFTDIDDKIIKRGKETQQEPAQVASSNIDAFRADMAALKVLPADVEPKVTEHIAEVVTLVEALCAKGVAYPAGGDVYYAVEKFAEYGKLGRRTLEDMEAGARVEVSANKRHPMDFVLWKAAKAGEPSWDSPWGAGRPGWHIECSAMAKRYLGESFDLHGGGRDLIFPHHENEVAQSEAAHGQGYARVWAHGGLVNIDNEKMSKSLGNFFTIRQVLEKFDAQTLRYYLLATHYRSPIAFSDAGLRAAEQRLRYCYQTLARMRAHLRQHPKDAGENAADKTYRHAGLADLDARLGAALQDDFNTPQALGILADAFTWTNEVLDHPAEPADDLAFLRRVDQVMADADALIGLFGDDADEVVARIDKRHQDQRGVTQERIESLVQARKEARHAKDFAKADALRRELDSLGVVLLDGPTGTSWRMA